MKRMNLEIRSAVDEEWEKYGSKIFFEMKDYCRQCPPYLAVGRMGLEMRSVFCEE